MRTFICTVLFIGILSNTIAQNTTDMKDFDPAFAHIVYFWFKDPANVKDKTHFEVSLKKFLSTSKYAKTNFIGTPPKATRDVVDGTFTYSLIVTFESAEAQQSYQEEDVHLVFIEECKHLWDKVLVYDSNGIK
ncbi:Dabb family protein [Croceitalea rosinachiae]|uniref:Dabb family protein n=1 Tax=Croceitalea rosinachiae TaxID=3075596 RepID=A0ABU3AA38_9FLAO|nr:Dabb family protein [Croceitalea sp. F388]MDT0605806.1 Dabb family protein [Croceitalea sp. F388]